MLLDILTDFLYKPSGVCEQHDIGYFLDDRKKGNPYKYAFPGTFKHYKNSVDRTPIIIIKPKKPCLSQ